MECVIEVYPRTGGEYHACIQGTAMWGSGKSIEEAVVGCINTSHALLRLTAEELKHAKNIICRGRTTPRSYRASLGGLVQLLSERGFEVDIRFLPTEIR